VVTLPAESPVPDAWTADLDLHVQGDALEGTLALSGTGVSTTVARRSLPAVPAERLPAVFERLLVGALPGVRVSNVKFDVTDPDRPATVRLDVQVPLRDLGDGRRGVPDLLARPLTADIAGTRRPADYLTLERRETPLFVRPAAETVRLRLALPSKWRVAPGWDSFALEGPAGFVRQTLVQGGDVFEVERTTRLGIRRIAPADHPSFAQWARATVEATDRALVLQPPVEGD
jgi:hypothetical protein